MSEKKRGNSGLVIALLFLLPIFWALFVIGVTR